MSVRIINADVMDGLAQIEDESCHACVTDPPYHLTTGKRGGAWTCFAEREFACRARAHRDRLHG